MDGEKLAALRAKIDCLRRQIDEESLPRDVIIREEMGEPYIRELENLSDTEAVRYLRSVEDSRVWEAYWILSKRLNPDVLKKICLDYMVRPGSRARLTGVSAIGTLLKKTRDEEVSRLLARIVRNPEESDDIRLLAQCSLELVNWPSKAGVVVQRDNTTDRSDENTPRHGETD